MTYICDGSLSGYIYFLVINVGLACLGCHFSVILQLCGMWFVGNIRRPHDNHEDRGLLVILYIVCCGCLSSLTWAT